MNRHDRRAAASARRRGEETGIDPFSITVAEASRYSGLSEPTIWKQIREHRLDAIRVQGLKRTLIVFESLKTLLDPASSAPPGHWYSAERPAGRRRKVVPGPERAAQPEAMPMPEAMPTAKRRGRPPGSKNKPKATLSNVSTETRVEA